LDRLNYVPDQQSAGRGRLKMTCIRAARLFATVFALLTFFCSVPAVADPLYYLDNNGSVSTTVPIYGVDSASFDTGNLQQTSYLGSAFDSAQSVSAAEPYENGALYSFDSQSNVFSAEVNNGQLHGAVDSFGGTLDPYGLGYVGGSASDQLLWYDTIYVSGNLPFGTPVLLDLTSYLDGVVSSSGSASNFYTTELGDNLEFTQLSGLATSYGECGQSAVSTQIGDYPIEQFTPYKGPLTTIDSSQTYYVCTTEGATFGLTETLLMQTGGSGQWSGSSEALDTASTQIVALTPGAGITSASGVTYSGTVVPEPSPLFSVFGCVLCFLVASLRRAASARASQKQ